MRRLLAAFPWVLSASCVIIIEPGGNTPVPIPPMSCSLEAVVAEAPVVHIFFTMRIERSTVNLADRYSKLMQDTSLALAAIGANVTTGVLVRQDERPVLQPLLAAWGCVLDDPRRLVPADVIRYYATNGQLEDDPSGCAIQPLINLGVNLSNAVTSYPPGVNGTSGQRVFGSAPDLVLVVHVDSLGRETGFDEPPCYFQKELLSADPKGTAQWLQYAGAVPQDRIVHWFISTEELVTREQFVAGCKAVDGFPSSVLDNLEESKKAFYGPLAQTIAEAGGGVASLSMCRMLVEPEQRAFIKHQVEGIAGLLGLSYDEKRVSDVLEGGFPALIGDMQPPEGGFPIPGP